MSAILSADDLNDFISPGVACIKPVETLPVKEASDNPYEVTTEDKVAASNAPPASISLTDCLACSGCVTSAEAVLVSLQSHAEVLNTLDAYPSFDVSQYEDVWTKATHNGGSHTTNSIPNGTNGVNGSTQGESKIFVASISPQARASIAATYGISEQKAGYLINQLLSGPQGLKSGGNHGSHFTWVLDTNTVREATLVLAADEVQVSLSPSSSSPKKPILTSACPGWICYAEKTHPYVLPHLSRLKSPQALAGTLLKSVLSQAYHLPPSRIWHLAIMPCFDKKLEASRTELTSASWASHSPSASSSPAPVRDVDCVITARELLTLATSRGIALPTLPLRPLTPPRFPSAPLSDFLFPRRRTATQPPDAGTSGGYLHHILRTLSTLHPSLETATSRGRNADVLEYALRDRDTGTEVLRMARFYGFRNIQNLVRRLRPKRVSRMPGAARKMGAGGGGGGTGKEGEEYVYVEVMACPGGCTNGGGQVRAGEVVAVRGEGEGEERVGPKEQREWLGRVDEAYFSAESEEEDGEEEGNGDTEQNGRNGDPEPMDIDTDTNGTTHINGNGTRNGDANDLVVNGISHGYIHSVLEHWSQLTQIPLASLVYTSYREVESDVGKGAAKKKVSDVERVAGLASSIGGGW